MKRAPVIMAALVLLLSISVTPVHAQTQATINAEARADFGKADVDLNKTYQAVLAKLPPNEKQELREAQRAWVASRDAEATEAAKEAGGSIGPTVRYGRMTALTRKRIAELNAMHRQGKFANRGVTITEQPGELGFARRAQSGGDA